MVNLLKLGIVVLVSFDKFRATTLYHQWH